MTRTIAVRAALGLLLATSAVAQDAGASDAKEPEPTGADAADSPPAKPRPPRPVGIAPT